MKLQRGYGSAKKRAPTLRTKRAERRRRRKLDPFLQMAPHPRKAEFTIHSARQRLRTDVAFAEKVTTALPATTTRKQLLPTSMRSSSMLKRALRRVWDMMRGEEVST